jgi:hypothetical protein
MWVFQVLIPCALKVYDDRGPECVSVSVTPPLGISVLPEVSTQLIHVSTSGYLWIYTGAEHWINRAVLLVVVVVVIYDDKPPLRGRWVNVLFLIFHSQIYCMSADTEAGDGI